ncbi:AAA family [Colletotrichum sojae]|uniref:AAA family n=1 Tax=Colletotrichum sojae TaxID=2175907 RepID=A0A8H6IV14_9PEZI|nr:AAA family [Colletotrichum sojae]
MRMASSQPEPGKPSAPEEIPEVKGFEKSARKSIGRTDEVRQINKDGYPTGVKVDIRGPRLQKALLDLNKDMKGFGFEEDPLTIDTKVLFHSLAGLERLLAEAEKECPVDKEKVLNSAQAFSKFSMSQTSDANWNDDAFKVLVLDESIKEFVHDLVTEHKSGDIKAFDDVVRDKGRGLVGLLAGSPGVGKAISEISRRLLSMISSGELGYLPTDIHKNLIRILELAEHWDAVAFLDEADGFLAYRDNLDLAQNATVSVLLRELEYYQEILILTTNRATTIDTAFQSRIHFSLQYPELDLAGRRTMWQNFIKMAKRNIKLKLDIDDRRQSLETLAELQLNGRQIRNSMRVAQAVALKRGKPLTLETIRTAMKLSQHAWLPEAAR